MQKIYKSYRCVKCKKEFVLLSEQEKNHKGYLVCPYCSSKKLQEQKQNDSLKECMHENAYKRKNGALRQVR